MRCYLWYHLFFPMGMTRVSKDRDHIKGSRVKIELLCSAKFTLVFNVLHPCRSHLVLLEPGLAKEMRPSIRAKHLAAYFFHLFLIYKNHRPIPFLVTVVRMKNKMRLDPMLPNG